MFIVLVIISLTVVESALGEDYNDVDTSSGRVRGQKKFVRVNPWKLQTENYIFTYLGIPYAKPPLKELRFQKPKPAEAWNGTFNADKFPPACVQHSSYPYPWFDQEPGNNESCLFLNIYQPSQRPDDKPFPVIFVIHGGYFIGGSSRQDYYNGEYYAAANKFDLIDGFKGAVLVTFNYRLGAFGFLTTATGEAPGNVGMYDMLLAFKWVKENAAAFNGDPNKITLIGSGAGSVAVSLFCVSPETKGQFSAAILNGGTFVSTKKNKREANLQLSASLAQAVNCSEDEEYYRSNPKEVVTCLQEVDANKLAEALNSLNPGALSLFNPEYDGELFPSDPVQALKNGEFHDVAIFVVVSSTEGSLTLTNRYPEEFGRFGKKNPGVINTTFATSILMDAFKSYHEPYKITRYYLYDIMASHYLHRVPYKDEQTILQRTMRAIGDDVTYCPAVYFAEKYGDKYGKAYFLEFNFQPPTMPWAKWMESVHFNDAPYMLQSFNSVIEKFYDENGGGDLREHYANQYSAAWHLRTSNIDIALNGRVSSIYRENITFGRNNHGRILLKDDSEIDYGMQYNMDGCDYLREYQGF